MQISFANIANINDNKTASLVIMHHALPQGHIPYALL